MAVRRNMPWSATDDRVLRKHGSATPDRDIAHLLPGRTQQSIQARRFVLGIKKHSNWRKNTTFRYWTQQEETLLLTLWNEDRNVVEIGSIMHRTETSVTCHLEVLRRDGKWKPSLRRRRKLRTPAATVKRIVALHKQKQTYTSIAMRCGIARETVHRIVVRYRRAGRPSKPQYLRSSIEKLLKKGTPFRTIVRTLNVSESYVYRIIAEHK